MKKRRSGVKLFLTFVVVYAVICVLIFVFQKKFIYFPYRDLVATPGQYGLEYRDVFVSVPSGPKIHGWLVDPKPEGVGNLRYQTLARNIIFFHGNGGNISYSLDTVDLFATLGFRTFIVDYAGYGRSEGSASEEGLYAAGRAALEFFCKEVDLPPEEIIFVGRSLGGGVAVELALETPPAALVLESAFSSIWKMAGTMRYLFPLQILLTEKFDNLAKVPQLACPLLVVHSPADEIVPFEQGRSLFEAATCEKRFLEIRGDHNHGYHDSGELYSEGILAFLDKYVPEIE